MIKTILDICQPWLILEIENALIILLQNITFKSSETIERVAR